MTVTFILLKDLSQDPVLHRMTFTVSPSGGPMPVSGHEVVKRVTPWSRMYRTVISVDLFCFRVGIPTWASFAFQVHVRRSEKKTVSFSRKPKTSLADCCPSMRGIVRNAGRPVVYGSKYRSVIRSEQLGFRTTVTSTAHKNCGDSDWSLGGGLSHVKVGF